MEKEIKLQLAPDEINVILEGLGNLPFVKVFQVIGKIQEQAARQLSENNGQPAARPAAEPAEARP